LAASLSLAAAPRVVNEYELKAAYIFKLAKFTQWPPAKFERDDSPLVIGVVGDEALDFFTRSLGDKAIDKHKILVQRLDQTNDLAACHVLFLSRSVAQHGAQWAEAASNSAVLTVGETGQFLDQGGMIDFVVESGQLHLEINDQRARRVGLNISGSALATLVNMGTAKIRNF